MGAKQTAKFRFMGRVLYFASLFLACGAVCAEDNASVN